MDLNDVTKRGLRICFVLIERSKCSSSFLLFTLFGVCSIDFVQQTRQVPFRTIFESINDQLLEKFVRFSLRVASIIEHEGDGVNYVQRFSDVVVIVGLRGVFYQNFNMLAGVVVQIFGSSNETK